MEGFVGGPKADTASGNGKSNVLFGLKGDERAEGAREARLLFGGPGADDLFGGGGNEDLRGGPGPDSCDVGPGGGSTTSC
jgi:Ca2+-binding RTX toxin-like protein